MADTTRLYDTVDDPSPPSSSDRPLNEVLGIIGLGPFQFLVWTLVALVAISSLSAPTLTLLSVTLPAIRCEWELGQFFEAAIPIAMFGTSAVCSAVFGKFGDVYGRKPVLLITTVIQVISIVASAIATNKWVFLAGRLVTGGCVGVNLNTKACYATEFAESKYRAYGVFILLAGCFLGSTMVNIMAYFLLNALGWRWFMAVVSAPIVPAIILMIVLPESPRYLCVSGRKEELSAVLSTMAKINEVKLPSPLEVGVYEDEELGSYRALFNDTNRRNVISLSVVYSANVLLQFGLIIFLPLFFSSGYCGAATAAPEHNCQLLTKEDLWKLALSSVVSIAGPILALVFATRIGRLIPLRISNFLIVLSLFALFICLSHVVTMTIVSILKLLDTLLNTLLWIIMPETFATCLRSTALGFIGGWSKIGGVVGAGMVYLLFYVSPNLVIGVFIASSLAGFLGTLAINKESRDLQLQDVEEPNEVNVDRR